MKIVPAWEKIELSPSADRVRAALLRAIKRGDSFVAIALSPLEWDAAIVQLEYSRPQSIHVWLGSRPAFSWVVFGLNLLVWADDAVSESEIGLLQSRPVGPWGDAIG
jgi:hypothetical protein